jgi:STE24 endopeptidase
VATTTLMFPWKVYTDFLREHQYGLANQDFGAWLGERAIAWALAIGLGALAVSTFYAAVRRTGRRW